ncbi:MAG: LysR family transcriptional regulator [Gammaproteobacteria bacterium]|nr:MAG: LysR family transcriptional regulator [Gammaproteobacteria bacterium]
MDIPSLKAFLAVAEKCSFSAAADYLHITQPAVSKRISTLESKLNTPLFHRAGRKVLMTTAGSALYPRAQHLLLDMEDIRRSISNLSGEVSGQLNIGTSHHIGLHRLPPYLRHYSMEYPKVTLNIKFIDSEQAYDDVLHGDLEMGIVTLPPKEDKRLKTQLLWRDTLCFVVSSDHPLAQEATVSLQRLTEFPAILPSHTTFTRKIVDQLFDQNKLALDVSISTNYLETIKMMVSIGLGWSVLPESMIPSSSGDDEVIKVAVKDTQLYRDLGCVYHPVRTLSNAAQSMLDNLTRPLAKMD